jgi:hypothetical protein
VEDLDRTARKIESGDAWDETDAVVDLDVKRPLDKVVPIRLSAEQWEELRGQARERGVSPAALMRTWVLEKLRRVPVS